MSEPFEVVDLGSMQPYEAVDLGGMHVTETTPVVAGPRGPAGPAGPQGEPGPAGADGTGGEGTGPAGPQGIPGPAGADGADGETGPQGPAGAQGVAGPTGPQGLKGDTGATGATGPQGVKGDTGAQGPAGTAGATGPAGADGATGAAGAAGATGPKGDIGDAGPAGAAGATGAQGPAGDTGPQGEVGATGPAGEGVDPASDQTITGEWAFADTAEPTAASLIVPNIDFDTGDPIPGRGFILTAPPGSQGNLVVICSPHPSSDRSGSTPASQSLSVSLVNDGDNGETLYVALPTDGAAATIPTSSATIIAAVNSTPAVAARVVGALPTGSDGSDTPTLDNYFGALTGGTDTSRVRLREGAARSAVRVEPDELNAVPVTIRTAVGSKLGTAAVNVEYRDGEPLRTVNGYTYGVSHLDNDGGGGLAADHITWGEHGNMVIDVSSGVPLTLKVAGVSTVSFGGSSALSASSSAPDQPTLQLAPHYLDQTADTVSAYGPDQDALAFRVRPDGAVITMGTEPADADLAPGQCAWWFDPTPGSARVRFKGKDSAGTVVDLTPPA